MSRRPAALLLALAVALVAAGLGEAVAQGAGPFGVARPEPSLSPAGGGLFAWIAAQQSAFYRQLSAAIRAARTDGSALWLLVGLSFAYGIFHAAGPGHGKAVISSYILASGDTLRRGLALSFAGAMLQAIVAVLLVLTFAVALRATSMAMNRASFWLEAAGYAAMAGLGLWLVFTKGRSLVGAARGDPHAGHAHAPGEACGDACAHIVGAERIAAPLSLSSAAAIIFSIGIRPCTGAVIVLVFALAQGLLWAGVAATFAMAIGTAITVGAIAALAVGAKAAALKLAEFSPRGGSVALRGLEFLAAFAVLALGVALLGGLLASGASLGG